MFLCKKGFSSIVVTILLIVVSVISIIGFQIWFNNYQSQINIDVERGVNSGSSIIVERLEVDGFVYVKNQDNKNVTILDSKLSLLSNKSDVPGCSRNADVTIIPGVISSFIVSDTTCSLLRNEIYGITLITNSGVFRSIMIAR